MIKIPVSKVELTFTESPHFKCSTVTPKTFDSMGAVNSFLRSQHYRNAPDLGYYKTDFTITWADGNIYQGRFDIGSDREDLTAHVKSFCSVYSLRYRPQHFKDNHWEHFCKTYKESGKKYGEVLDKYQLD